LNAQYKEKGDGENDSDLIALVNDLICSDSPSGATYYRAHRLLVCYVVISMLPDRKPTSMIRSCTLKSDPES
jgi:hypothetical protein